MEIMLVSKWRPSAILNLRKLRFWSHYLHRHVMEICIGILNLIEIGYGNNASEIMRKLQFWSRDLHRHVILHFCRKFRVDRPIQRRYIAKTRFSIWRPSAILSWKNFDFLVKFTCSEWKFVSVY